MLGLILDYIYIRSNYLVMARAIGKSRLWHYIRLCLSFCASVCVSVSGLGVRATI